MLFDFSPLLSHGGEIVQGTLVTIEIAVVVAILCVVGGLLVASISLYAPLLLKLPVRFFIWLFMGTPLLLQLYLLYFGLGQVGIRFSALTTGIVGLGVHYMAYNADIFRATILSIDSGQFEASRSLGLGRVRTFIYIIIPQTLYRATPQIGNNLIIMLKDTSVLSMLGVAELIHASQYVIATSFRPFELYISAAVIYYLLNLFMEYGLNVIDNKVEART